MTHIFQYSIICQITRIDQRVARRIENICVSTERIDQ